MQLLYIFGILAPIIYFLLVKGKSLLLLVRSSSPICRLCYFPVFTFQIDLRNTQFYPHLVEDSDGLPVVGLQHVEVGPAQGRDVGVQVEGVTAAGADHLLRPVVPPRLDEGDLEAVSDGPHMLAGVLGPRPEDGNNSLL